VDRLGLRSTASPSAGSSSARGGLKMDTRARVLRPDGTIITRLYAGGKNGLLVATEPW
jgi:hypothetical protein